MKIVHNKVDLPNVLVREVNSVNGGILLTKLFLDSEVSNGRRHHLIVDLSSEVFVEALVKAYDESCTGFGSVPFGLYFAKTELVKAITPSTLYEHDLLLWFV